MCTSGRKTGESGRMYFGYYEHSLDDKGRLMIPSKLREGLISGSPLYVIRGFEGCLSIYNESTFSKLYEEISKLSYNDKTARNYIRNVLGSVVILNVDKLGRIQIPNAVLSRYNIAKNVAVIGVGDHFEIWDLEIYQNYQKDNDESFEESAQKMVNNHGGN